MTLWDIAAELPSIEEPTSFMESLAGLGGMLIFIVLTIEPLVTCRRRWRNSALHDSGDNGAGAGTEFTTGSVKGSCICDSLGFAANKQRVLAEVVALGCSK